jgi:hypothetical protein
VGYRVHIVDENGEGIGGTVTFFDADGLQLGKFPVPTEGADAPIDFVDVSATFQIDSPGYVGYAVLSLKDWNEFVLVKDNSNKTVMFVLIALGLLLAGKLIRG